MMFSRITQSLPSRSVSNHFFKNESELVGQLFPVGGKFGLSFSSFTIRSTLKLISDFFDFEIPTHVIPTQFEKYFCFFSASHRS